MSRAHSISIPWFLDLCSLAVGETEPYIGQWFRPCISSWRTLPQLCEVLSPSWHCNWVFKRGFHHSIKPAASGRWGHVKTSEFHEHGPIAVIYLLQSEFLYQKVSEVILCRMPWQWIRHFVYPFGSLGRNAVSKEGKSISKVFISSKNKMLPPSIHWSGPM